MTVVKRLRDYIRFSLNYVVINFGVFDCNLSFWIYKFKRIASMVVKSLRDSSRFGEKLAALMNLVAILDFDTYKFRRITSMGVNGLRKI